jgi:2-oxoisovalerate dehydrogenase E1 component
MPKSIVIEPEQVFARDTIHLSDIPVNAYQCPLAEGSGRYSREDFLAIWQDMCAIREFETILQRDQDQGHLQGRHHNHAGPGAPVDRAGGRGGRDGVLAFARRPHLRLAPQPRRDSGQGILRHPAIERRATAGNHGSLPRRRHPGPGGKGIQGAVRGLALRFFVYGAYSEIFARETGFNRGLGGSMHAFFTPFGIYPNNAIVGGSGSIAPGAALFKRVNRKPGIVVCNIGDASFGCGPVWEGITFSAMDQYRKLWDKSLGGGLPIMFNCMNNFYGMGGQPMGETMGVQFIARIGAGRESRTDACRARERLRSAARDRRLSAARSRCSPKGAGRCCSTPSPTASAATRLRTLRATARRKRSSAGSRPIPSPRSGTQAAGQRRGRTKKRWKRAGASRPPSSRCSNGRDLGPARASATASELVGEVMFSNRRVEKFDDRPPEFLQDLAENPRVQQIQAARSARRNFEGKPTPKMKAFNMRDGIFEAMLHRFAIDPTMIAFGEENRDWGGAFAVYRGSPRRCRTTACSTRRFPKPAIVGAAVGYALEGGRVVAELMYADFMGRAGDEIFNQLSKWQAMSAGTADHAGGAAHLRGRQVRRAAFAGLERAGAPHSGLKVVYPGDALRRQGHDERRARRHRSGDLLRKPEVYDYGEMFVETGVPEGYYEIDLASPR